MVICVKDTIRRLLKRVLAISMVKGNGDFLSEFLSGYISNRCCSTAVMKTMDDICPDFDDNLLSILLLDFSEALVVSHDILL